MNKQDLKDPLSRGQVMVKYYRCPILTAWAKCSTYTLYASLIIFFFPPLFTLWAGKRKHSLNPWGRNVIDLARMGFDPGRLLPVMMTDMDCGGALRGRARLGKPWQKDKWANGLDGWKSNHFVSKAHPKTFENILDNSNTQLLSSVLLILPFRPFSTLSVRWNISFSFLSTWERKNTKITIGSGGFISQPDLAGLFFFYFFWCFFLCDVFQSTQWK